MKEIQNFFIEDYFFSDLDDYIDSIEADANNISGTVEDDFSEKAILSTIEPVIIINRKSLIEMLCEANEERFPEDPDHVDKDIVKAIDECVDFDKLKSMIPNLYYGNGDTFIIDKKYLQEIYKS